MADKLDLKQALSHVLWIGGGPDAGKTSVAQALCEKYNWHFYWIDEEVDKFWGYETHDSQDPTSFAYQIMQLSLDELMLQPPEIGVQTTLQITAVDFPFLIDELLTLPAKKPILVEGNLPADLVEPLLTHKAQAIWMIPTEAFAQEAFFQRKKHVIHDKLSDPEQTLANHIARNQLYVEHIREGILKRGLPLLKIDGLRSIEAVAEMVAKHFAPHLAQIHQGNSKKGLTI